MVKKRAEKLGINCIFGVQNKLKYMEDFFNKTCNEYSQKIDMPFSKISIRDPKSRWGSCSHKGEIIYNWRIILAPHRIVDYVVVHELCHLLEHNHSPKYWRQVERYTPDWKNCRNWK